MFWLYGLYGALTNTLPHKHKTTCVLISYTSAFKEPSFLRHLEELIILRLIVLITLV